MELKKAKPMIMKIVVEDLFHTFSYTIAAPENIPNIESNLLLLYGNNGSGKTTVLNLLYHLLDPEPYGGHRSFVGSIPFKKFEVHTSLGYTVSASRPGPEITGTYEMRVISENNEILHAYRWDENRSKRTDSGFEEEKYQELCKTLKSLGISFHYLRDNRRVEGAVTPEEAHTVRYAGIHTDIKSNLYWKQNDSADLDDLDSTDLLLLHSLRETVEWIRTMSIASTNEGSTNVNSVYKTVIQHIVSKEAKTHSSIAELTDKLSNIMQENAAFSKFGLTPELNIGDIKSELIKADSDDLEVLNAIIVPYLEAHSARLDALDDLRKVISNFVSLLETFYEGKQVEYTISGGVKFLSAAGHHNIKPTQLSSGEKQLLLLFCNAIVSRDHRSILIIDEPEISLNVKWQRDLIPALLRCLEGTEFQLLIATHSVEILSQYREAVSPLVRSDVK